MMSKAKFFLVGALILVGLQTAFALKEQEKEDVRKQISSVKAWQLIQDLNLSEEQAQALFPTQKAYEDRKEELRARRETLEAELDELLKVEEKDDELIKEKMAQLKSIDKQTRANEDKFHKKISKILTVEQQAKYELFDKKFNTRLRQMIQDIKKEKAELKIRTKEKSRESLRRPRQVVDEKERKDERREKQKEKERGEAGDENKNKKKSTSQEKRSTKERSSRESGSSKEKSSRARRR